METRVLILTDLAATLLTAPASPQDKDNPAHENRIKGSAKKIKELQKEQIGTLKEMTDQATVQFQNARISYEPVIEARLLLLKAELDAVDKEADRITILKNFVDL